MMELRQYQIKPIETEYNGVLFRSNLEARWAIIFDLLDIEWLYEPEGFQLPSGWYLPDFYIPRWNTYIEIKPNDLIRPEQQKLEELVQLTPCWSAVSLTGYVGTNIGGSELVGRGLLQQLYGFVIAHPQSYPQFRPLPYQSQTGTKLELVIRAIEDCYLSGDGFDYLTIAYQVSVNEKLGKVELDDIVGFLLDCINHSIPDAERTEAICKYFRKYEQGLNETWLFMTGCSVDDIRQAMDIAAKYRFYRPGR